MSKLRFRERRYVVAFRRRRKEARSIERERPAGKSLFLLDFLLRFASWQNEEAKCL